MGNDSSKSPVLPANNVVSMAGIAKPGPDMSAAAGGENDPRMQEAVRLMESFLAIEDPQSRGALVKLAEGLVSCDWVRKAQQR